MLRIPLSESPRDPGSRGAARNPYITPLPNPLAVAPCRRRSCEILALTLDTFARGCLWRQFSKRLCAIRLKRGRRTAMSCQRTRGSARARLHPSHPKHHSARAHLVPGQEPCRRPTLLPGRSSRCLANPHPPTRPPWCRGARGGSVRRCASSCKPNGAGLRLAAALAAAARDAGDAGAGLRQAAEEIALSCAYTTERELARRRMRHVCDNGGEPGEGEEAEARGVSSARLCGGSAA